MRLKKGGPAHVTNTVAPKVRVVGQRTPEQLEAARKAHGAKLKQVLIGRLKAAKKGVLAGERVTERELEKLKERPVPGAWYFTKEGKSSRASGALVRGVTAEEDLEGRTSRILAARGEKPVEEVRKKRDTDRNMRARAAARRMKNDIGGINDAEAERAAVRGKRLVELSERRRR